MPGFSLPNFGFHRRNVGIRTPPLDAPSIDEIVFPQAYAGAWEQARNCALNQPLLETARVFLLLTVNSSFGPRIVVHVRTIAQDRRHRTIPAIAFAIQQHVFGSRHESFAATPLLQIVRFMLIHSQIPEALHSDRTRIVMDFFFDPTLERNLDPRPTGDVVVHQYPAGRLKIVIVGGGPTALASAISLAEKGRGKVEVHMYERRWVQKQMPDGTLYMDYPVTARRRDQVVTLQDSVTRLLSPESFEALFAGRPERVWPASSNIQIRKVEDRFLKRVQEPEFHGTIHLHPEPLTQENLSQAGDFHVLLGADGAASWVRQSYFNGYENERGRSYALGIAFDRPAGLPWSQPLNVFLTLGQTRYLLNASDHDGRGYLNMQLTEEEWEKMVSIDGQYVHFGRPGCLRRPDGSVPPGFIEGQVFEPSEDRASPFWQSISNGLKLFGFKESEVINIVRIPITVQAVQEGVQILPPPDSTLIRRPHALVAVAGDAAMTVHFWPGRGLNSGIKTGLALGDELVHALKRGEFVGIPLSAMKEYNNFILKLQLREHDQRSIPILNQSGTPERLGWLLSMASDVPDCVATEWLIGAMLQIADRLEVRPDWPFPPCENIEGQLRIILRQLDSITLREMAVSFPWPTREMAGAEVLPIRSTAQHEEKKRKWLQSLWQKLKEDSQKTRDRTPSPQGREISTARFEVPRSISPLLNGNKSSSATTAIIPQTNGIGIEQRRSLTGLCPSISPIRHLVSSPPVLPPIQWDQKSEADEPLLLQKRQEDSCDRLLSASPPRQFNDGSPVSPISISTARSPCPDGELILGRMLSIHRKPLPNMLGDALSLALFRIQETA